MKFDFISFLWRQRKHSIEAFGPGRRTEGLLDRVRKELKEIEAKPDDLEEWVDLILLGLDGARRCGITDDVERGYCPEQIVCALVEKMDKNERRKWPDWQTAEPGKAIEHIRNDIGGNNTV